MPRLKRFGIRNTVIGSLLFLAAGLLVWGVAGRLRNQPEFLDPVIREADGMTMVYVPAGSFKMGAPWWMRFDVLHYPHGAFPQHEVTLDAFWIDQTEVTAAQWRICVNAGVCGNTTLRNSLPMARLSARGMPKRYVTWYEAEAYCTWAGGQLPTEAQWEYAARGPENRRYPWGNYAPSCDEVALRECETSTGASGPSPVGSFPAGASWVGALDMAGNVMEFVADWSDGDVNYYDVSPRSNPTGPAVGERKVMRGGAGGRPHTLRSYLSYVVPPDEKKQLVGFRCVVPAGP